jgi:DNA (cytosine-5)-methyltransferase 1
MQRINFTHGSLFSGIGGFDLAADWMGWENVFHCEINPFSQRILKHYWPKAISYDDIKTTDFSIHRGGIDILTGGFPCQPYSNAGKRLGKQDERHLWPYMLRAIQQIEPTYIVGENVRGLINWSEGLVFEEVCAELESCGYEVQPILLAAAGVGAPHRRERVWFVASNPMSLRLQHSKVEGEMGARQAEVQRQGRESSDAIKTDGKAKAASNTNRIRLVGSKCQYKIDSNKRGKHAQHDVEQISQSTWDSFPTQPPVCGGDDGLPVRLDGITFSKWRKESIMGYGNAIVPQVAYQIFKTINSTHGSTTSDINRIRNNINNIRL